MARTPAKRVSQIHAIRRGDVFRSQQLMAVAVVVVMTLLAILGVLLICRLATWHRTPRELRGDWWERFEQQFRAYETSRPLGNGWMGPERRRHPR